MSWALAAGDVLAHYRVLSPLGSGGMAQVYLAEDVRLGRRLALKVLSPRAIEDESRMRRFEREARTISALNHPNILTVYDVGQAGGVQFLATEYIEGTTLRARLARGPLPAAEALPIAVQIAQALAAAHGAGVIHRDLKPENVMVRADGYVKVLDFGLAKLAAGETSAAPDDSATRLMETREGVVLGTFNYMAPEQARGGDLDPRADLFAFGVVLYEMLSGAPPFKGPTAADVIGAVLYRDPEPLTRVADVPPELDRLVARALRKDREARYQTCAELLQDLRAIGRTAETGSGIFVAVPPGSGEAAAPAPAPTSSSSADTAAAAATGGTRRRRGRRSVDSLAVLPLANGSRDADLDYVSDGLTESLINNLSQLPKLRVMARSTVFRYKGQDADPLAVGRALGVHAVLTGHITLRGDAFVIGAELVDVADGSQLWGTSLTRRLADVFVLQAEISQELTEALRLRLTRDEKKKINKRHTLNAEAWQLYLRGRYFLNARIGDALGQARALFERAVAEDPGYALAWAGLADCCSLIAVSFRSSAVASLVEQARAAALRAQALDPGLAEGHASLAFIRFRFDEARAALQDLRDRYDRAAAGADDLALLAAALGDGAEALTWLTEACRQRSPFLGYVDVEPAMTPLLQDPGCRALLQRQGFRGTT